MNKPTLRERTSQFLILSLLLGWLGLGLILYTSYVQKRAINDYKQSCERLTDRRTMWLECSL